MSDKITEVTVLPELSGRTIKSASVISLERKYGGDYDIVEIVFDDDKEASFTTSDFEQYASWVTFVMENQ